MISELSNHVWQSTLFALTAALLTFLFRRHRAVVRYYLWLSASFKFLFPFSLLMALGKHLEWTPAAKKVAIQTVSLTLVQITAPVPDTASNLGSSLGRIHWFALTIMVVWAFGFALLVLMRFRAWLRIRAALHSSVPIGIPLPIETRSCPGLLEPGAVGIIRPVLLLPAGITAHLTLAQMEAVVAHELCHVRRRDNLLALIHMVVEAIFWFHPLVWWIGARLIEEREQACDEDVLSLGGEPRVYIEAILNVCKHYLESPLVCVSGITGSDLKKRIDRILAPRRALDVNLSKKILLTVVGILAVAAPVVIGITNVPATHAQTAEGHARFEVASVKPTNSEDHRPLFDYEQGQFRALHVTVHKMVMAAYGIQHYQVLGGPAWIRTDLFDIDAKPGGPPEQVNPMLQSLLAERFQLVLRHGTKEVPGYVLVVAKNGPTLKRAEGPDRPSIIKIRRGLLVAPMGDMETVASELSSILGRPVVDRTGITGHYDLKLEWQPDDNQAAMFQAMGVPEGFGAPAPDPMGPSLYTALQEQLGLKLESEKSSVEMLSIERIEKPSAN